MNSVLLTIRITHTWSQRSPYHGYGESQKTLKIINTESFPEINSIGVFCITRASKSMYHRYGESATFRIPDRGESIFEYEYFREFKAEIEKAF
jgi:hypothetical protein